MPYVMLSCGRNSYELRALKREAIMNFFTVLREGPKYQYLGAGCDFSHVVGCRHRPAGEAGFAEMQRGCRAGTRPAPALEGEGHGNC